jgi:hypothetical protein
MEIKINGKAADITLESEKTVVEVLAGIQQWLEGLGLFVSGLEIDGTSYGASSLDSAFELPLTGLSSIDIKTSGWAELMLEALMSLKQDLELYRSTAETEEQKNRRWEQSAPALFLKDHGPDIYEVALKTFASPAPLPADIPLALVMERIREIEDPLREMAAQKPLAEEIAKRLEDLPLDMQTGKDSRAAETINLFSSLVEKIFRLIFLFRRFDTDIQSIKAPSMNGTETISLREYIGEFSAALKELTSAYENKDTILVGDLAEYELAPRLRGLIVVLCSVKPEKRPE